MIVLVVLLPAALVACSRAPGPALKPSAPVRQVDPETWRLVDRQIVTASVRARHAAEAYARVAMEEWQGLVRQRTEEVFIPWYLNYWTQQWIGARVAWYGMQGAEGGPPNERLVAYLQEQYYGQVLEPVSHFIDPGQVMEETLGDYLRSLREGIDWLPLEYGVPLAAFNRHLDAIPAIEVQTAPPQQASLYQVLQSPGPAGLPAYEALLGHTDAVSDTAGQTPSSDRLQTLAGRAVASMADSMALRGGALAASSFLGGPLGVAISAGATVWGVVEHDRARPAIEAQLRADLEAAFDAVWQSLVEDVDAGVMAPMHHLSAQIERAAAGAGPEQPVSEDRPDDPGRNQGPALLF